jgi:hypothetical protein
MYVGGRGGMGLGVKVWRGVEGVLSTDYEYRGDSGRRPQLDDPGIVAL